jgi:hypothetical protein
VKSPRYTGLINHWSWLLLAIIGVIILILVFS